MLYFCDMGIELSFIHWLQAALDSRIGGIFSVFSARYVIFLEIAWILLIGLTDKRKNLRHAAREAGISLLLAMYVALMLSNFIGRLRPFMADSLVYRLIPAPLSMHSFPSAHASAAFALAFAIAWTDRRTAIIPVILAVLVGFGRVATGVHYPSDVLAGVIVGFVVVFIVRLLHAAVRRTAWYHERHG